MQHVNLVTTKKLNQGKKSGNKIHQLPNQKYGDTAQSGVMERRRDGNHSLQKNNSIQDSGENEENGYLVPELNKTMINVTKELSNAHKKILKEEIWEEISEKFMEEILDMVKQNL
jgi:hypothetical protein